MVNTRQRLKTSSPKDLLQDAQRILLLTHKDPDLDGAGASAALGSLLRKHGKQVVAFAEGSLPSLIETFSMPNLFSPSWPGTFDPDLICVLDAANLNQLGKTACEHVSRENSMPIIVVDHHLTRDKFGTHNQLVNPQSSSTSEIVYGLMRQLKHSLTPSEASLLLAGIIADTGRFRYAYTSSNTMSVAAALMKAGANLFEINEAMDKVFTLDGIHLWGELLQSAHEELEGSVIWSELPLNKAPAPNLSDTVINSELYNFFLRARGCHLVLMFKEQPERIVKVNIRSSLKVDSTVLARYFGGGGHARAAACRLEGSLATAESQVLAYVKDNFPTFLTDETGG